MRSNNGPSGIGLFALFLAAGFAAGFAVLVFFFSGADAGAAADAFASGDPLIPVVACALGFAFCSFLAGLVTRDYSWVDRLWSVLPVFFAWYYAWRGAFRLPVLCAAILVTAWGCRLTWNFAKKGGYSGCEDYRWAVLRGRIRHPLAWQLFNLGFISLFQIGAFVFFTLPMAKLASAGGSAPIPNVAAFCAGMVLMAAAIVLEAIADSQQWEFQEAKRRARGGEPVPEAFRQDIERGFRSSGLFALIRHPNYLGELMTWISLYAAAAGWARSFLDASLLGPGVLLAIFSGSTVFTESLSAAKYPAYAEYRRRVGSLFPRPGR